MSLHQIKQAKAHTQNLSHSLQHQVSKMIQELECQNQAQSQLGYGMHPSGGPMHMSPHGHGHGHGHSMMKPHMQHQTGYMPSHQSGGYSSGMPQPQHHQMGHYHGPSGPKMSSTSMNSSHYSNNGGMYGGPDMSRTEYDSFQKTQSPGSMHESKYHQEQSSYGNNGGMGFMAAPGGYGGRRTEWVTKAL